VLVRVVGLQARLVRVLMRMRRSIGMHVLVLVLDMLVIVLVVSM
jgi:hypothetical protein